MHIVPIYGIFGPQLVLTAACWITHEEEAEALNDFMGDVIEHPSEVTH